MTKMIKTLVRLSAIIVFAALLISCGGGTDTGSDSTTSKRPPGKSDKMKRFCKEFSRKYQAYQDEVDYHHDISETGGSFEALKRQEEQIDAARDEMFSAIIKTVPYAPMADEARTAQEAFREDVDSPEARQSLRKLDRYRSENC